MFRLHPALQADTVCIGSFSLSLVLLHKDANYPWCILVPKREDMHEIHHLATDEQIQLIRESSHLAEVMSSLFAPTKMNIAALGNIVPQLHIHHVARFDTDAAWPKSIWGVTEPAEYTAADLAERIERLQAALVGEGFNPICETAVPSPSGHYTP